MREDWNGPGALQWRGRGDALGLVASRLLVPSGGEGTGGPDRRVARGRRALHYLRSLIPLTDVWQVFIWLVCRQCPYNSVQNKNLGNIQLKISATSPFPWIESSPLTRHSPLAIRPLPRPPQRHLPKGTGPRAAPSPAQPWRGADSPGASRLTAQLIGL